MKQVTGFEWVAETVSRWPEFHSQERVQFLEATDWKPKREIKQNEILDLTDKIKPGITS